MILTVLILVLCSTGGIQGQRQKFSRRSLRGDHGRQTTATTIPRHIDSTCECGKTPIVPRLSNGLKVFPENFHGFMAMIKNRGKFRCAGTLINDRYILTSADCIRERDSMLYEVILGIHNITLARDSSPTDLSGQPNAVKREISHVKIHGSFDPKNVSSPFNIGLLKLKEPIKFTDQIFPICLPSTAIPYFSGEAYSLGWGEMTTKEFSPILIEKFTNILNWYECESKMKPYTHKGEEICAKSEACTRDGGGPLFRKQSYYTTQYGVLATGTSCDSYDNIDIYTNVQLFVDYIYRKTRGGRYCRNINAGY